RSDLNMAPLGMSYHGRPFGAYSAPAVPRPAGAEINDDWYFYWSLAKRLGGELGYDGGPLDMGVAPTTDELLGVVTRSGVVPLDEIKRHPGGHVFDVEVRVQAPRPEASGAFDVMPDDVAGDMARVLASEFTPGRIRSNGQVFTHLLAERRHRNIINSVHGI